MNSIILNNYLIGAFQIQYFNVLCEKKHFIKINTFQVKKGERHQEQKNNFNHLHDGHRAVKDDVDDDTDHDDHDEHGDEGSGHAVESHPEVSFNFHSFTKFQQEQSSFTLNGNKVIHLNGYQKSATWKHITGIS